MISPASAFDLVDRVVGGDVDGVGAIEDREGLQVTDIADEVVLEAEVGRTAEHPQTEIVAKLGRSHELQMDAPLDPLKLLVDIGGGQGDGFARGAVGAGRERRICVTPENSRPPAILTVFSRLGN